MAVQTPTRLSVHVPRALTPSAEEAIPVRLATREAALDAPCELGRVEVMADGTPLQRRLFLRGVVRARMPRETRLLVTVTRTVTDVTRVTGLTG